MDAAAFAEMDKVGQTLLNIIQGWENIIENYYWTLFKVGQTLLKIIIEHHWSLGKHYWLEQKN